MSAPFNSDTPQGPVVQFTPADAGARQGKQLREGHILPADKVGAKIEVARGPYAGHSGVIVARVPATTVWKKSKRKSIHWRDVKLEDGRNVTLQRKHIDYRYRRTTRGIQYDFLPGGHARSRKAHSGPLRQIKRFRNMNGAWCGTVPIAKQDLKDLRGREFKISGVVFQMPKFMAAARKHKIWIRGNCRKVLAEFKISDGGRRIPLTPEHVSSDYSRIMLQIWYDWCEPHERVFDNRKGFTFTPKEAQPPVVVRRADFEAKNATMANDAERVEYWVSQGWPATRARLEVHRRRYKNPLIQIATHQKLPKQFMLDQYFKDICQKKLTGVGMHYIRPCDGTDPDDDEWVFELKVGDSVRVNYQWTQHYEGKITQIHNEIPDCPDDNIRFDIAFPESHPEPQAFFEKEHKMDYQAFKGQTRRMLGKRRRKVVTIYPKSHALLPPRLKNHVRPVREWLATVKRAPPPPVSDDDQSFLDACNKYNFDQKSNRRQKIANIRAELEKRGCIMSGPDIQTRYRTIEARRAMFSKRSWTRALNDLNAMYAQFKATEYFQPNITKKVFRRMIEHVEGTVEGFCREGTDRGYRWQPLQFGVPGNRSGASGAKSGNLASV